MMWPIKNVRKKVQPIVWSGLYAVPFVHNPRCGILELCSHPADASVQTQDKAGALGNPW